MRAGPIPERGRRKRRGVAAVELALVLPILLLFFFGLWEVGTLVGVRQVLGAAAREGGRQASTGQLTEAEVVGVVLDYLRLSGVPTDRVSVSVSNLTNPAAGPGAASQFDELEVVVTIPFDAVRKVDVRVITTDETTLSGRAVWYSMKDKPYPAPPEPTIE
ncbi:TadE/TadG family type IV pilus assembly protein [Tautonia sociabilis]|uniref:Pilus assembly protein TadE n=1 Tax=Tautonia sociabilis TaxID=2080755 RepID=A0A432MLT3_9BACT|nr:TadE/TadG family type IV pilus assembly protein [Tautonia sociabilis]RUL88240.1 pilus assembly protein TadE [Tautonia sociabilis]